MHKGRKDHTSRVEMSSEKPPAVDSSPRTEESSNQKTNWNSSYYRTSNKTPNKKEFKEYTLDREDHIFNVHSEQKKKGEFNEVIERIKAYGAKNFPGSVKEMSTILEDGGEPLFRRPDFDEDCGANPDEVDR